MTFKTVAGPLGSPHRSGRATGDHHDPAAKILFPGRTAHPLGSQTHPASPPGLALGNPVPSCPCPAAYLATPFLTRPMSRRTTHRTTGGIHRVAPHRSATVSPRGRPAGLLRHRPHGPSTSHWWGHRTTRPDKSIGVKAPPSINSPVIPSHIAMTASLRWIWAKKLFRLICVLIAFVFNRRRLLLDHRTRDWTCPQHSHLRFRHDRPRSSRR